MIVGVEHGDDVGGVLHQRPEARLTAEDLGVEAGAADRDVDMLAERAQQAQVVFTERLAVDRLDVERADDLSLVGQRHADFRGDPVDRAEEVRVGLHIFDQDRLTRPRDPAGDPVHHGEPLGDAVGRVANLVLEHEPLALDQAKADERIAERIGHRGDDLLKEGGEVELARDRGPNAVHQRQLLGLAQGRGVERPQPLLVGADSRLGPLALGDVAGVDDDATQIRVVEAIGGDQLEPASRTVAVPHRQLEALDHPRLLLQVGEDVPDMIGVVGVKNLGHRVTDQLVRGIAKDSLRRGADVPANPVLVDDRDDFPCLPEEGLQARFAGAQRRFRLDPASDVAGQHDDLVGPGGRETSLEHPGFPGDRQPVLEIVRPPFGQRPLDAGPQPPRDWRRQHLLELAAEKRARRHQQVLLVVRFVVEVGAVTREVKKEIGNGIEQRPLLPLAVAQLRLDRVPGADVLGGEHDRWPPREGQMMDARRDVDLLTIVQPVARGVTGVVRRVAVPRRE